MTSLLAFTDILKSAGGVLAALAVLLAMVTIHEFGHYLAGKLLGFKINEFSVGFGPAIFKKRSKATGELFALRVIPLGGYCAFDGEDDEGEDSDEKPRVAQTTAEDMTAADTTSETTAETSAENTQTPHPQAAAANSETTARSQTPQPQTTGVDTQITPSATENTSPTAAEVAPPNDGKKFNDQAPWKRIIVLFAGATMNYLLGLILVFIMFCCIGRPLYSVVREKPTDAQNAASAAVGVSTEAVGLQDDDIILRVEGKKVYLITDYISALRGKNAGDTAQILVLRDDGTGAKKQTLVEVTLTISSEEFDFMSDTGYMIGSLGIYALRSVTVHESFGETLVDSFVYAFKQAGMVLASLGELLTGKMSLGSMGGPITTIRVTSQQARSGWLSFLNIASFIGINLAVFNLLPIPALDGSKIVFCIIEAIRKKPVNRKVEAMIHFVGIIVLFAFAILVDVLQFLT